MILSSIYIKSEFVPGERLFGMVADCLILLLCGAWFWGCCSGVWLSEILPAFWGCCSGECLVQILGTEGCSVDEVLYQSWRLIVWDQVWWHATDAWLNMMMLLLFCGKGLCLRLGFVYKVDGWVRLGMR